MAQISSQFRRIFLGASTAKMVSMRWLAKKGPGRIELQDG
jgi:hypothetical protein